jgi:dTDP-4-amino-4,6-dideoxygalactose transaminase
MKKSPAFPQPITTAWPSLPSLEKFANGLERIWESRQLTNNGPLVQELEEKLKTFLEVQNALVFSNGTLALMLACKSLGLTGEVITTPFTFPATLHALTWNGLTPLFCDIRPDDFTLNANLISSLITPTTSAIMPVHVFGNIGQVDQIEYIARQHGLKVIYDAAHAFGVRVDGKSVASLGNMSMFSMHATKPFHTVEGGILAFNDDEADNVLRLLRNFGIQSEEEVVLPGINAKLNEVQALVGLLLLEEIAVQREYRAQLTSIYAKRMNSLPGIRFVSTSAEISSNYAYAVIQVDPKICGMNRDDLELLLKDYNILTRKYFYPPGHEYPHYRNLLTSQSNQLPVTRQIARQLLTLPLYNDLSIQVVNQICDIIEYIICTNRQETVSNP